MFKQILKKCSEGITLTRLEAKTIMNEIMNGNSDPFQVASLLSMMRLRGETVEEMVGFAEVMRARAIKVIHQEQELLDTCGTGGDDLGTFNISTATAILVSACGVKVAKHGNRAISSKSGSADVLERLQIPVQASPEEAADVLKETGLCFLFAPFYHQAMKNLTNVRTALGFKTVFNLLGPLVNPANANRQVIGVFNSTFAEKMAETLRELGTKRAVFVTGGDGLDEFSITASSNIVELTNGVISRYTLTPEEVGLKRGSIKDIQVSSIEESAQLIRSVFEGTANETAHNIIVLNCAAALYVADNVMTIKEGVAIAQNAIASGKAFEQLRRLQAHKGELQC